MTVASKLGPRRLAFENALACFVALAAIALFAVGAQAQTAEEAAKIVANLKPESQAVIARLSAISNLPDGTWKMHSGDLAHGEAISLDENSWQAIAPRGEAPNDAVWFRQTYTVPTRSAATT